MTSVTGTSLNSPFVSFIQNMFDIQEVGECVFISYSITHFTSCFCCMFGFCVLAAMKRERERERANKVSERRDGGEREEL